MLLTPSFQARSESRAGGSLTGSRSSVRLSAVRREGLCEDVSRATAPDVQSQELDLKVLDFEAERERRALPRGWKRAGDRGRTGDVQLGKLFDEGPEDYDPWA